MNKDEAQKQIQFLLSGASPLSQSQKIQLIQKLEEASVSKSSKNPKTNKDDAYLKVASTLINQGGKYAIKEGYGTTGSSLQGASSALNTYDNVKNKDYAKATVNAVSTGVNTGKATGAINKNSTTANQVGQGANAALQGINAYDAYQNKDYVGAGINAAGAVTNSAALSGSQTAASVAPYINTALAAKNVYDAGNTKNVDATTRAAMAQHEAEVAVGSYYTFGIAGLADAAIKKWAPNWYEEKIQLASKNPETKAMGKLISGKDTYQFSRDQSRKRMKDAGLIDDKYVGTLADGTKYDFGKDGGDLKLDYNDALTGDIINKADLLALAEGNHGKSREANAMLYTKAALSNAGGDINKARENIKHMMRQRGFTKEGVDETLKKHFEGKKFDEGKYKVWQATSDSFLNDMRQGGDQQMYNPQGTPGRRPGWRGKGDGRDKATSPGMIPAIQGLQGQLQNTGLLAPGGVNPQKPLFLDAAAMAAMNRNPGRPSPWGSGVIPVNNPQGSPGRRPGWRGKGDGRDKANQVALQNGMYQAGMIPLYR